MLMMRKRMVRMVCSRWVHVRFREMPFVSAMVSSWKAATQVVCEHVQLLPGAIGGIVFSGHGRRERNWLRNSAKVFLLAASPSSEVPKALDGERFVGGDG